MWNQRRVKTVGVGTSPDFFNKKSPKFVKESRPPFLSGLARDDHDHPGGAGVCLTRRGELELKMNKSRVSRDCGPERFFDRIA